MAPLVTIAIVMVMAGVAFGAYLKICFAIRRDDRVRGSLRFEAPSKAAQSARDLTGISSSRWD